MTVIEKIEAQQKNIQENTAPWVVGEQLKEICRNEPTSAELLDKDLDVEGMSIVDAEKKIKAYADKHKTGTFAFVPTSVAEDILRGFYGLPGRGAKPEAEPAGKILDLSDFMG